MPIDLSEIEWRPRTVAFRFRAAPGAGELPTLTAVQTAIWTPPNPRLIRGVTAWEGATALVGGGGATGIDLGISTGAQTIGSAANLTLVALATVTPWGGIMPTGGVALGTAGRTSQAEGGIFLCPPSSLPENTSAIRLTARTDAGTVNGDLILTWEEHPIVALTPQAP